MHPVPFTKATDEIGGLARSIDVLKRGAAAMEEQRWVKANIAKLTGALQGAPSHAEFGQRLLSGLVPVLGGGVAGFYLPEDTGTSFGASHLRLWTRRTLRESLRIGRGVGRPVRERPHVRPP